MVSKEIICKLIGHDEGEEIQTPSEVSKYYPNDVSRYCNRCKKQTYWCPGWGVSY